MDKSFSAKQLPAPLREFYAAIQNDLVVIEQKLHDFLDSKNPFIKRVVDHGFRLGGKRMRPALHLLFAQMAGSISAEHYVIGAALETIHTASLVHDDILDEALTRRHLPTINAAWDNETSVLMGDFMVARAMLEVAQLNDLIVNQIVAETSCALCDGEMRQVGSRGRFDLSEEEYCAIISGKTAALFECACRLGVFCALKKELFSEKADDFSDCQKILSDERVQNAAMFGRCLGQAFQIADDLLDILGSEEEMGKTLGSDLAKQKLTLPIIRLLAALPEKEKEALIEEIKNNLNSGTYSAIRQMLTEYGIYDSVRNTAVGLIREAIELLTVFPESEAKSAISSFANYAIERQQ